MSYQKLDIVNPEPPAKLLKFEDEDEANDNDVGKPLKRIDLGVNLSFKKDSLFFIFRRR